jgi:hypothetical protein
METEKSQKEAFFYAVYLMGIENGIIEPLEQVDAPDLKQELPDDQRDLVESIRDVDIDTDSPPDEVQLFYENAKAIVSGRFVDHS